MCFHPIITGGILLHKHIGLQCYSQWNCILSKVALLTQHKNFVIDSLWLWAERSGRLCWVHPDIRRGPGRADWSYRLQVAHQGSAKSSGLYMSKWQQSAWQLWFFCIYVNFMWKNWSGSIRGSIRNYSAIHTHSLLKNSAQWLNVVLRISTICLQYICKGRKFFTSLNTLLFLIHRLSFYVHLFSSIWSGFIVSVSLVRLTMTCVCISMAQTIQLGYVWYIFTQSAWVRWLLLLKQGIFYIEKHANEPLQKLVIGINQE